MKQTIAWHKECLKNARSSLEATLNDLYRRRMEAERQERDLAFLALQIAEAEDRGMTAFDSERLMKKRKQ